MINRLGRDLHDAPSPRVDPGHVAPTRSVSGGSGTVHVGRFGRRDRTSRPARVGPDGPRRPPEPRAPGVGHDVQGEPLEGRRRPAAELVGVASTCWTARASRNRVGSSTRTPSRRRRPPRGCHRHPSPAPAPRPAPPRWPRPMPWCGSAAAAHRRQPAPRPDRSPVRPVPPARSHLPGPLGALDRERPPPAAIGWTRQRCHGLDRGHRFLLHTGTPAAHGRPVEIIDAWAVAGPTSLRPFGR